MSEAAVSVTPGGEATSSGGTQVAANAPSMGSAGQAGTKDAAISVKASVDQGGATSVDWQASLRPELKDWVGQKGFKDVNAVADSYRNLEKLHGVPQERILKLPESPEADGWGDVWTRLGKPTTPDGYGITTPEGGDAAFDTWAKDAFHKMNLTTTQAKGLMEKYNAHLAQTEMAQKEAYDGKVKEQELVLRKEWGSAYHQNVAAAQRAQTAFGLSTEAITALEGAIGFDGVMKFMSSIGSKIGEHGYVDGQRQPGFGNLRLTPDQARVRISELKADPEFIRKYAGGDVESRNKMNALHQMAYPSD